ncbi:metallophosphoesterase [Candidatus Woesearchaeota archaeon]|nr:metallophosphoesterase [Candidatus Woesearchaeota archaeon]
MNFVNDLINRGYLVSPGLLKEKDLDSELIFNKLDKVKEKPLVIDKNIYNILKKSNDFSTDISWKEFDKSKVYYEKSNDSKNYNTFLDILNYNLNEENKVKIDKIVEKISKPQEFNFDNDAIEPTIIVIKNYEEDIKKRNVQDFVKHFKSRYNSLKNILINRLELKDCISINRVSNKNNGSRVSIIGLISDKRTTKNGNIFFELEDLTGKITCIVGKNNKEMFEFSQDLMLDEVIGLTGTYSDNIIFANTLLLPDIPMNNELKRIDEEFYCVFTSDIHVGSKMFLEKDFLNFIDWLNGNYGDENQRQIASKIKFLFLGGDLIEGVGIYPAQEDDLLFKDIKKQYDVLSEYLIKIRKDIQIVIIGGNHDSLRLAEPQPKLHPVYAKSIYELGNTTILTNPSMVNIFSSKDFEGFNILLYHGSSYPYLADNVESVRIKGRLDRADLIMKHSLQARHLAPTHNSVQYIPGEEDTLVIDKIPDFYLSGHIHKVTALNYRGVTLIGGGCWTEQTEDQEKRGIVPEPSKVVVVNMKSREVKIFNFKEE